jgi:hypothetical protein
MPRSRFFSLGLSILVAVGAAVGLLLALNQRPAHATILRVKPGGGGGDFSSINAALAAAQPGDTILVAAGAYTENVLITETVTLEGGWDVNFTFRDPAANPTTVRPADPLVAVVDIEGQFADTSAVAPTLDGFILTGARSDNHGGGLRMRDSNGLIRNNVISDNVAFLLGGGVWVQRGAPYFENNRIENNVTDSSGQGGGVQLENTQATLVGNLIAGNVVSATGYGGGVDVVGGGPVTLTGNIILSNTSATSGVGYGGGVSIQGVTVTLSNNLIQSNTAGFEPGAGPYLMGGGVYIASSTGLFSDNTLIGNRANRNTIFGNGGGLAVLTSTLTIQGGELTSNSVSQNCEGYGGGLYALDSSITLDAARVEDNCASNTPFYGLGGGLAFVNSPYTLTNALVVGNYAFGDDTAVGGLFAGANSPGRVVNTTFVNNNGQGLRVGSPLTVTNSLIMSHTTGISLTAAVPVSVTYNDFYANTTNQSGFSLDSTNIVINPQLDAAYHLLPNSPLIDAGARPNAPLNDFDNEPRPMAGSSGLFRVDIGADEFTGPAQNIIDLDSGEADFTLIGPGNPNPTSNGPNDYIGYAVLGQDLNGDSRADLMVSAEDWAEDFDNPPLATGRLYGLFNFGGRLTGTVDLFTDTASLTVVSQLLLQHIGSDLVGGDLNDDGNGDLIFGSYEDDGAGNGAVTPTVFALWGGASLAAGGTRTLTDATPADFMVRAPGQDFFSFSAKNALTTGDVNGDGVADVVIGDGVADHGASADTGAAFVVFGGNGLSGVHDLSTAPADYTLYGAAANEGLAYVALGRVNTGASIDLVARTDITACVTFGPFTGTPVSATTASADVTITGLQFGSVIIADLTGDGQDDVILGSGSNLYVVPGPLNVSETFDVASRAVVTLTNVSAESWAVGQAAGDARPDLIIGAPFLKQAFVIPAGLGVSGTLSILDVAPIVVQGSDKNLGYDVAVGDLDLDNRPDLIVSTWRQDVGTHPNKYQDAGVVYVIYGEAEPTERRLYLPVVVR